MTWDWGRSSYSEWTTQDEINIVRGIADRTNPYADRYPMKTYSQSIREYLKTMDVRSNWGAINREKVRSWCMEQLAQEAQKGSE